ncbi:MAG: hypothetical protein KJN97_06180 [Deltaproteobacteria bacterium]|nr:hypothetical protein [Deltaproteobacteria bacterium]
MSNTPAIQFYIGDWKRDTALARCSTSTRGVWFEILLAMHDDGACGKLCGKPVDFLRICRCTKAEFALACKELRATETATVTRRNGSVTIINRRMQKEWKKRQDNAKRQRRHREKQKGDDE